VIVGWSDTVSQIRSITDTAGNVYHLAVGPTLYNGGISQAIYYANGIKVPATGLNTVSVNFTGVPVYPDVRVVEYSGIDPVYPIDVSAAFAEGGPLSTTGSVTITNTMDLLVGANTVETHTDSPGTGFTQRLLTSPDGDIAEDCVVTAPGFYSASAPLGVPGGFVMQLVAFRAAGSPAPGTMPPPDTTPPTLTITAPAAGAQLTGTATVTVTASDAGSGVAAVQLQVDGVPYGTGVTRSPYTFSLDTSKFGSGSHTLTASASDLANNVGSSSPVSVSFSNSTSGNPNKFGMWSGPVFLPAVAVNSVLLSNGKVLMWDGTPLFGNCAIVWNPVTNTFDSAPVPGNIFCSGMDRMADGRILVAGGHILNHEGLPIANVFNPTNESWTVLPNMAYPRWYPTVTTLPNGQVIVTSGETNCDGCYVPTQEIYDPSKNSWGLLSTLSTAQFVFPYYPHGYVLPDGRLLIAASAEAPIASQVLDLNASAWTPVGGATIYDGGSSAMYLPLKFLKMGTSVDPDLASGPSAATAYVLDLTQSPTWRPVHSMAFARTYHNTTLLPDGNVLVTGGGTTTDEGDIPHAVLAAESWSPATEMWTTLAPMSIPRLYHSEALLLPDGRVLVSGGGRFHDGTDPTDQFSVEFFAPPYLFKGPRPIIASPAPSQLLYGQNFTVVTPDATRIANVTLIRLGSVTHAFNMSQRLLPLPFSTGTGLLTVTAPANANVAPPGDYMLFLVDTSGIPSVAAIVHF
jgi:hypothetical protein